MKPAMTTGEWADAEERGRYGWMSGEMESWAQGDTHKVAALCLVGQPFGFTRDMVTTLGIVANYCRSRGGDHPGWQVAEALDAIADRIEALLPPEEP